MKEYVSHSETISDLSDLDDTDPTVLARCFYHAAFPPGKHPTQSFPPFPSLIDVRGVGWK